MVGMLTGYHISQLKVGLIRLRSRPFTVFTFVFSGAAPENCIEQNASIPASDMMAIQRIDVIQ